MSRRLVVYAREPIAGRVKSRLAAAIGADHAAAVYELLLEHAVEVARRSGVEWTVSFAEPPSAHWVERLEGRVEVQQAAGLGGRLLDTFTRHFEQGALEVVVVGSDCPALRPLEVRRAFHALARHAVVLGPARDGGYWLVGQRGPPLDLFSGVPWSSSETLAATRRRLTALGTSWEEVATMADVDTEADLSVALKDTEVASRLRHRLVRVLQPRQG